MFIFYLGGLGTFTQSAYIHHTHTHVCSIHCTHTNLASTFSIHNALKFNSQFSTCLPHTHTHMQCTHTNLTGGCKLTLKQDYSPANQ